MDIALGLPNAVPGVDGAALLDWARVGEEAGFSGLATTDRLVYDSCESLTVLAAAAAVTQRCTLTTAILVAPLRGNGALLAKQAATVDRISDGRLVLGMAVGVRPDDFTAAGAERAGRGAAMDRQLDELQAVWAGDRRGFAGGIGPLPTEPDRPRLVFGGHSPAAVARVAARGTGWIGGSGGPAMFASGAAAVRDGWVRAGREGRPRTLALLYVALGPDARDLAAGYLGSYYGFAPGYAQQVIANAAVGADRLAELAAEFAEAGCDELVLLPCTADRAQLDLITGAMPGTGR